MIRLLTLSAVIAALVAATGCGKLKNYCDVDATRIDAAVGQALAHDVMTISFEQVLERTDVSEMGNRDVLAADERLRQLNALTNLIEVDFSGGRARTNARRALESLCRRGADGLCETTATARPRPDHEKLAQLQRLTQGLRAQYCNVAVPTERCLAALGRLTFGRYPETEAACAGVTTDAAARCVDIAVATHALDIPAAEVEACAAYYHPTHVACATAVAGLGFGINSETLAACGRVWSDGALACVRRAVATHVNDMPAAEIRACFN